MNLFEQYTEPVLQVLIKYPLVTAIVRPMAISFTILSTRSPSGDSFSSLTSQESQTISNWLFNMIHLLIKQFFSVLKTLNQFYKLVILIILLSENPKLTAPSLTTGSIRRRELSHEQGHRFSGQVRFVRKGAMCHRTRLRQQTKTSCQKSSI